MNNNNDEELEEDIERLKQMDKQLKQKEEPQNGTVLQKLKRGIKQRYEENKQERALEREVYKKAYRKAKYGALKQKAQRQAQRRFGRTTGEKVARAVLGPDYKKRRKPSYTRKPRVASPKLYTPHVDPFGGKQFNTDFSSALGGFGKPPKKKPQKPLKIDPFEKMF